MSLLPRLSESPLSTCPTPAPRLQALGGQAGLGWGGGPQTTLFLVVSVQNRKHHPPRLAQLSGVQPFRSFSSYRAFEAGMSSHFPDGETESERTKGMTPKHSVQLTEQPFLPLSSLSPANRPTHRGQITLLELPSGCLHLCLSIANLYPDVPLTGHPPRRAFLLHLPLLETKDSHLPAAWGTEWFQT